MESRVPMANSAPHLTSSSLLFQVVWFTGTYSEYMEDRINRLATLSLSLSLSLSPVSFFFLHQSPGKPLSLSLPPLFFTTTTILQGDVSMDNKPKYKKLKT